jgi:hypothetical protein
VLTVSSSTLLQRAARGDAFSWWYVDVLEPNGDGLVLIWSLGLPFIPRLDAREADGRQPTVALAVYSAGRESLYCLDVQRSDRATWSVDTGRYAIGRSTFSLDIDAKSVRLHADLDLPIARSHERVLAHVRVEGPRCRTLEEGDGPHAWSPLAAATTGHASVKLLGRTMDVAGRAYVDGNASSRPLGELGIADWRWGRLALPDRELVYFLLESSAAEPAQSTLISIDRSGDVRRAAALSATKTDGLPSLYGLRGARQLRLEAEGEPTTIIVYGSKVDDGPFYQRYQIEGSTAAGERGRGFAERLVPARAQIGWLRHLVRMRVHRSDAPNSMWLPLFNGPREGRWARLARASFDLSDRAGGVSR